MMKAITIPAKMTLVLRKSRPHKRFRLFKKGAVNRRRRGGEENLRTRNNFQQLRSF